MSTEARSMTSKAPPGPTRGALRLTDILVSGLPGTLGTSDEPTLYTVPVVLSRQVTPAERATIEDPATARRMAHAGPEVSLTVSDRRLLISDTNLGQLREGLAADLAAFLRSMAEAAGAEELRKSEEEGARLSREQERAAFVATAVAGISFE